MSAALLPRFDFGRWSGPAIGEEADPHGREVSGRVVVFAWLGAHFEFVVAREFDRRAQPNHGRLWLLFCLAVASPFLAPLIAWSAQ